MKNSTMIVLNLNNKNQNKLFIANQCDLLNNNDN